MDSTLQELVNLLVMSGTDNAEIRIKLSNHGNSIRFRVEWVHGKWVTQDERSFLLADISSPLVHKELKHMRLRMEALVNADKATQEKILRTIG